MRKRLLALVMVSMFAFSALPLNGMHPLSSSMTQAIGLSDGTRADPAFAFDSYHDYAEIKAELERLSTDYPEITQMLVLGRTWEGRDIMAMRVTDNPLEEETVEPDVLIMGAHHANELPSAEVPMYILHFLVENYATNSNSRELVDSRDIWFVPIVNPDGREYSMNFDQEWRKNRRPVDANGDSIPEGTGVDLNRNYGHLWSLEGASTDPNNSLYCGLSAFSENETIAIRQLAIAQSFELSLSYHTYGELVSYPWNNGIDTVNPRKEVLQAIAVDMAERIGYTPIEGKTLYPTTGDSDDWLYSEFSTLSFTIELGTQRVDPDILGLCEKNLDAALYALDIAAEPEKALLPDWTFMVYMSADVDAALANEALVDINEMETAGSTANVNILVLYDGRGTGDSTIYRIQKDAGGFNSAIISPTVDDLGAVIDPVSRELDMSKPATLKSYAAWTMENYPAQKNLLVFWGHGDGVLVQFVPDKGIGMKIGEIHQALAGLKLDIVGFDTCLLGHFEVANELVGIADIMIGSEAKEPLAGWDYQATLVKLVTEPGTEPRALARFIISDYLAANQENYLTQAAIDLEIYQNNFLPALNDFANVSLDFANIDHGKIWNARNISNTFVPQQDAVDLYQFLDNLKAQNVSAPVMKRIESLLGMRDELVFASGTGTVYPSSRAMAVYFPLLTFSISSDYLYLGFCENRWDEYLAGVKAPASRPVLSSDSPIEANNTLGPYNFSAQVSGYAGEAFNLVYRVNNGAWQTTAMSHSGGLLMAQFPGQMNGSRVDYYFLDATNNITEPYEVKWNEADYFTFIVNASCDLLVSGFSYQGPEPLFHGNITAFRMNCSNAGPEPVQANITLSLVGNSGTEIIGWEMIDLDAGQFRIVEFNWTAKTGNWEIVASISQVGVFDRNASNQDASAWANVSAATHGDTDFLAEYGVIILALMLVWSISMTYIVLRLRKLRMRRKAVAAKSIAAAREFITTAAEFGGDVSDAGVMLARAEAALARNALPECERLVKKARESAMNAVGQREVDR